MEEKDIGFSSMLTPSRQFISDNEKFLVISALQYVLYHFDVAFQRL